MEVRPDGRYRVAVVTVRAGKVTHILSDTLVADGRDHRDTLGKLGLTHGVPIVLALPRTDALLRWAHLPATQPRQIQQMVRNEAVAQSPWGDEETCLGFETYPSDRGYSRVLVMMARHESVSRHLDRLRALGLQPARVEFSTLSLARLFGEDASTRDSSVLLARADVREYVRLSGGAPAFSRGAGAAEAPEDTLRKSLDLDVRKNGRSAAMVPLVLAVDAPIDDLRRTAVSLGLTVCSVDGVQPARANGIAPLRAEEVVGVGAALGAFDANPTGNLLPRTEMRRLTLQRLLREARFLAIGVSCTALGLGGAAYHAFEIERASAATAVRETAELQKEAGDLVLQYEQLRQLSGERERVSIPLRLMLDLYARTPPDTGLVQMVFNDRGVLILGGEAQGYPAVFAYLTALSQSPLLRDVRLIHSSKPRTEGKAFIEFKIQASITLREGCE